MMVLKHLSVVCYNDALPLCRMYLEVLGNTLVTEDTAAWVRKTAARLADRMEAQVTNQRAARGHVTRP